jgi:hypothetical protein
MKPGILRAETRPDGTEIEYEETLLGAVERKRGKEQLRIKLTRARMRGDSTWSADFHLALHVWYRSRFGDYRPSRGIVTVHAHDLAALRRAMDTLADATHAAAIAAERTG